jgi:capsular exopolysaccharide synthesis family protein
MSKFFNETIRAREKSHSTDSIKQAAVADYQEATSVPTIPVVEIRTSEPEQYQKLAIPVSGISLTQFQGSPVMDSVQESYRALRTRLLRLRAANGIQSVVISSAAQGEGKTLTSLNLALCCAQLQDMKVLLIDGDIRSKGLSRSIGSPAGYGLANVLAGECTPEQAILSTDVPNLCIMSAGHPTAPPGELLARTRWQELVAWCNERFRITFVDSPPVLNLTDVELLSAPCDGLLMVVRAQQTKREVLKKSASRIDPKKLLGVVFNAAEGAHNTYSYAPYGAKEN